MSVSKHEPPSVLSGRYTTSPTGCHIWQNAKNSRGYGVVWFDGKVRLAHRVAFYLTRGRWPADGLVVDHLCDTKDCVNPDHLQETTNWRNLRRAVPVGTPEQETKREGWRRANARRRSYSPSWIPTRGE